MAKNKFGFISGRYPQPVRYDRIFSSWDAIYYGADGKEYMIEAVPHYLSLNKEGANVIEYQVLRRDDDCRRTLGRSKTQKGAIEILNEFIKKT